MPQFWVTHTGGELAQGDLLADCPVPRFPADFTPASDMRTVDFVVGDFIVVTQSCDLANNKAPAVSMCPVYSLAKLSEINPSLATPAEYEKMRRGIYPAYHVLASPEHPDDNTLCMFVDFRFIHSLPVGYVKRRAIEAGRRWRLRSPYLEHFSQAFARFFMHVGLPSDIPSFATKKR